MNTSCKTFLLLGILVLTLGYITDPIPTPPSWFPTMMIPEDNALTPERWALGKRLFFDKSLSKDSTLACASCHNPVFAFADTAALSVGVGNKLGKRNAPSLANIGYAPYFHFEGGIPSLEMQVLAPIQEEVEFNDNVPAIAKRLQNDPTYTAQSRAAYQRDLDAYVITRALACFERSIVSGYSRFDRYQQEENYELTAAELRGKDLFFSGELGCNRCHSGKFFTDFAPYNIGLYASYPDVGMFRLTNDETDIGRFKTPTLRNIAVTAPYMHDGSMQTLDEVIDHYATGGKGTQVSPKMTKFDITPSQKADLIAFLHTLTDEAFLNNPAYRPHN